MGTPILGVGGGVKNSSALVANINNWALNIKADTVDTIAFGSAGGWNTKISTFKDWSCTFDGKTDPSDTAGQVALINGLGNTFTLQFDIDSTHHWAGSGILTGVNPKSDASGMNEISFSAEGTGAITYT